ELARIAARLSSSGTASAEWLAHEDGYFFSRAEDRVRLPVFRVIAGDGTRYYLDPVSATIEAKVDRSGKRFRWLHEAPHRMDFVPAIRGRAAGYTIVLILLSGVLFVCVTGAYLGWRRVAPRRRA